MPEQARAFRGDFICDARSDDLNVNGIRLFADYMIEDPLETMFTIGFTLPHGTMYLIPARLKRMQRNTATRSYLYDYGFMFDYTQMPERRDKLVTDILTAKLKGKA